MRVSPRKLDDYPFPLRWIYRNQVKKYGQMLLPAMVWGRIPVLFVLVSLFLGFFSRKRSPLNPVLRSLVMVRVSQVNSCEFCIDLNGMLLLKNPDTGAKLDALAGWKSSPLFTEAEKDALEYAERITRTGDTVPRDLSERIEARLGSDGLVELTALIAYQNLSSKFNSGLELPAQGLCRRN